MFQLAVSLAGSVEGLREKLRGTEGAAVITMTKIYEWQLITMERTLPVILLNYRGIRGRDIFVDNQTPQTPESYREFDIHVCAGFHTGFLAWGGGEIYWCINEARKCERRGWGYPPPCLPNP